MTKTIGILTAGGDSPGLNAAIRGVGKTAIGAYDMHVIGFRDGFRGLMENRTVALDKAAALGHPDHRRHHPGHQPRQASPHAGRQQTLDMTDVIVENYHNHHLDALVCLGGGGTQKNAYRLHKKGLNVVTLPKTIDNDVSGTDVTFGFDTALGIATEAIDRLHSTAHSHHRIIVVEVMGHNAGWLALGPASPVAPTSSSSPRSPTTSRPSPRPSASGIARAARSASWPSPRARCRSSARRPCAMPRMRLADGQEAQEGRRAAATRPSRSRARTHRRDQRHTWAAPRWPCPRSWNSAPTWSHA